MKSATFTSELTEVSSMITNNGQIKVQPGYWCSPEEVDWNGANTITFSPKTMTITFYTGDTQYHQATGPAWELTFPPDPENKENGSPFLYWVTAEGQQITDLSELSEDTKLYAVYADQSFTVTFNQSERNHTGNCFD